MTPEPTDLETTMTDPTAEIEQLRTENERLRHELEVMYGGAFDRLPTAAVPTLDRAALRNRIAAPADWVDGHPQLEAIAAAVWEKCGRSDSGMCIEDDPRNIAVAAFAAVLAVLPPPTDRAAAEAVTRALGVLRVWRDERETGPEAARLLYEVGDALTEDSPELPPPADRAAVLREAADIAESLRQFEKTTGPRWSAQVSENVGILRVADHFRRLADEAQPTEAQPDSATLLTLVKDFLDPDPCSFDHHGYCQAHAAGFGGEPMSCPHGRARKLLATLEQPAAGARQDGAQR